MLAVRYALCAAALCTLCVVGEPEVRPNGRRCERSKMLVCVREAGLRAIDQFIDREIIPVPFFGGVRFVKTRAAPDNNSTAFSRRGAEGGDDEGGSLRAALVQRLTRFLRTHALQIPLPRNVSVDFFQGRRRHHRRKGNDMMGLLLFGSMAMAIIAIPLGFQFLAVLGGKALMLAKLALILTSIQGLKKIATSHLNYGLYQSPPHVPTRHWLYDRRWQHGQPPIDHSSHSIGGGLFDGAAASSGHGGLFDVPPESGLGFDGGVRSRILMPRLGLGQHQEHQQEEGRMMM